MIRIVVLGHVDHGKSSLIGRLFHDAGALPEGRYDQLAAAAARRGQPFEWANLTDGLQIERDQNVTVDTAQIVLRTPALASPITFIDAPGHRQFLRNMITGATLADAALLVVDARAGLSDETRRHAVLMTLLGLTDVIVCVTKVDLVDDARVAHVSGEATVMLEGLTLKVAAVVPTSVVDGRGVTSLLALVARWSGPSGPSAGPGAAAGPFVFSVQDVYRDGTRRVLVGRPEAGEVAASRPVVVLPAGQAATAEAYPGVNALTLREPLFVTRGDVLASAEAGLIVTSRIDARIFWIGAMPFSQDGQWEVRLGAQRAAITGVRVTRVIDASTLNDRDATSVVPPHDVADVTLELARPVVVDPDGRVRALARIVIVDAATPHHDPTGGGMILPTTRGIGPMRATAATFRAVTAGERRARFGHGGAVVWLTGLSGAGKSTLATGLERALFDRGHHAMVIDGDRLRFGLNADLGFSPMDRRENIRRAAEVAAISASAGMIAITAFISPYAADRANARAIAAAAGVPFIEVYVEASLATCERRDVKGLYAKARAGQVAEFTGVSAPYEAPERPEVVVRTDEAAPEACVAAVLEGIAGSDL